MSDVLCPNCGMSNPPEQDVCSFCNTPLRSTDETQSIRPGDAPTKKTTAELEPVLPDWLRNARASARRAEADDNIDEVQAEPDQPASKDEASDFLAGLESASKEEQDEETPDWMRGAAPISAPASPEEEEKPFPRRQELHWEEDSRDELGGMASMPIPSPPESGDALLPWMQDSQNEPEEKDEVSNWLNQQSSTVPEQKTVSPFDTDSLKPPGTGELTDWLNKATEESASAAESGSEEKPAAESENSLGDWLSNLPRDQTISAPSDSGESFGEDIDFSDLMKPEAAPSAPDAEKKEEDTPLPDWMATFRKQERSFEEQAHSTEPAPEVPHAPAFVTGDEQEGKSQTDELFSIEMPDWLSNIAPTDQKPAAKSDASVETPREEISPAELPSWVQAMRPVETALPTADETPPPTVEGPLEDQGPLSGLRGVLPLGEELVQPGKPKAYAIRLQVSDSQHADANLLEQMLAAETQAKPLHTHGILASQRVLRWAISALLILLVMFFLGVHSQSIPLPSAPLEEGSQISSVLNSMPDNAPVLMIFDYEPGLAGELEAAAAPFVDQVFGLRHPRVTVLSTSPTGAALADIFLTELQSQHDYQPKLETVNFGYLPGGTIGILSFAENPRVAMPSPLWALAPAHDVIRFSDYATVILLTDQAETARAWVEQTTAYRSDRPLLVISSAQAAPMIQPYVLSGQVNGLVSGVRGGAAFETSSGVSSPVRGYWDAYNYATLFVAVLIMFGGLWNFFAGVRSRRQSLDEV